MNPSRLLRATLCAALLGAAPSELTAQSVHCRTTASPAGDFRGSCISGDSAVGQLELRKVSAYLWSGAATSRDGGVAEIGIDTRPGGALRLGRSWLALRDLHASGSTLEFSFDPTVPAPPTAIDEAILRRARAMLTDEAAWTPDDTTDMDAAPVRGFSCAPAPRQSMFCALYLASVEVAGDYAHFRPAVNAVREAVSTATARSYRHALVDFNNEAGRTLPDVHAVLDVALALIRDEIEVRSEHPCDRACLRRSIDDYLAAMVDGRATGLPLSRDARLTENGRVVRIGEGLWTSRIEAVSPRHYVLDPQSGGAAVQTVVRANGADVVLLVRLKIVGSEITEVETIAVREGDNAFFDPAAAASLPRIDAPVAEAQRNTREELVRLANAYFTALHTQGTPDYRRAPFAAGANRYENGVLTTNVAGVPPANITAMSASEQFDAAVFKGRNVVDRRYPVVDVENGTVLGIVTFRPTPTSEVLLLAEVFKIHGDELHEIRAVMLDLPAGAQTGWN